MGMPGQASLAAAAMQHVLNVETLLREILHETRRSREGDQARFHFEVPFAGNIAEGTSTTIRHTTAIAEGFYFRLERVMAIAPEGSKLQVFKHNTDPSNLIEVVANIQEYTDLSAGLTVEGPAELKCVVTGAKKEGPVFIVLSGQLFFKRSTDVRARV